MKITNAIGIFDSGVGGLTVFREIRKKYKHNDIIYFGDTARVPYGPKSKETIIEYSLQNTHFLLQQNVQVIVVACNTSSALAIDALKDITNIPILGVIEAGAETAISLTENGQIGVIGTEGTIKSHAYQKAIHSINKDIIVHEKACPLFVPLSEEGWIDNDVTKRVAEIYLENLIKQGIDTLVLGCTHYPILKKIIKEVCGNQIALVDSAKAILSHLSKLRVGKGELEVRHHNPHSQLRKVGTNYFFVSDNEEKFTKIARDILGIKEFNLQKVSFCKSWFPEKR